MASENTTKNIEIFDSATNSWNRFSVLRGKSAYQSYLDTTTDIPKKTEEEWSINLTKDTMVEYQEGIPVPDNVQVLIKTNVSPFKIGTDHISDGAVTAEKLSSEIQSKLNSITPVQYKTMGVTIDLTNSNPATCCTYINDAIGTIAGGVEWDIFFGMRPCLLKNGAVVGYLNPNNFSQYLDGTPADITSGDAGDVMIEFPRRGLTINTVGNIITVKMTDNPNDPTFEYNAHTVGTIQKNKFYLGAYKGYNLSSKLRSLSGKTPTTAQTIGKFRTLAQANGAGYEQSGFYQMIFRQCMYLLKYKHLNCQITVGRGFVDVNTACITTGGANTKGMTFGETTGKLQMKLFGVEDTWGNVEDVIDGGMTDASRNLLTATTGFNDIGTGYTNQGQIAPENIGGWMSKPYGTTKCGFTIKEANGSETTYFCEHIDVNTSKVCIFGGRWDSAGWTGIFSPRFSISSDTGISNTIGGRLMFL